MADTNGAHGADFSKLSNDLYQQWEQAMTAWWDQVLESPDVLKATGANLSTMARARKKYEQGVDQGLQRLHLPTRDDLVRVTRIATLLEERLLQVEDTLLQVKDQMDSLERETVQARVEAAETRLELRERLAELQARLDGLDSSAAQSAGAATTTTSETTAPTTTAPKTPARKTPARKTSTRRKPQAKSTTTKTAE